MLALPDTKRIPKLLGRNKATKIHALVDALRNPLKFIWPEEYKLKH
ncbi:hypothetical protein [Wolbachia endosymbiont of Laodelphax striatellus]|nr:hypothetical protein [Wolbachia endosymbiont of Laodelphax striatellus]